MPWEKTGSGYKTKRGGFVRNPGQYEKLRAKGMSKERAARITNSFSKSDGVLVEVPSVERGRDGKFRKPDGFQMIELDDMMQTEAKVEEVEKADHSGHYFNAQTGVVHEFKDSPTHQRARRNSAIKGAGVGAALGGAAGYVMGKGPGVVGGGVSGAVVGGVTGPIVDCTARSLGKSPRRSRSPSGTPWPTTTARPGSSGRSSAERRTLPDLDLPLVHRLCWLHPMPEGTPGM